ncbi:unnamed protein product [Rhizophagus irregularis]|nr:unnamed protein product [Rhizophagus irregularis]
MERLWLNNKRTKSVIQFWEVQDVARIAEEKSRAEVQMLQVAQHVTIATVTTEQVQQYTRLTTTKISEKFLDEKEKLPNDGSEDDGVHVKVAGETRGFWQVGEMPK